MSKTGSRYELLYLYQLTSSSVTECTIEAAERSISLMETHFSEITTRAALAEKEKLCKVLRRIDMMCYTVVAIIGLNALGAFAANGAQALTWLVISAVTLRRG
jgi:hypothetical protein